MENRPAAIDYSSNVDTSRAFRSVKEAVEVFGERFLTGEIFSPSSKPPFTLPKQEMRSWKPTYSPQPSWKSCSSSRETEEESSSLLATSLKKLETELEETKKELNLLKDRESETEVALASLNAELHKNMSKIAKAEAAEAAEKVAALKSSKNMANVKLTQRLPFKLHGLAVSSTFHPSRSIFFVSTKKNVRVYDLLKKKFIKKLEPGVREISSLSVHPGGDNVIVGSKDGKLCWFDMDLSSKPYKILKSHPKDITNVNFHRTYPLFASSSDDCTAYVFHGMVYSDLNQNPLIVPLEILHGHKTVNGRGLLDWEEEDGDEDEVVYVNHEEALVTHRVLNVAVSKTDDTSWLRNNIFRTKCTSKWKVSSVIIDGESCENMVAKSMVEKLGLDV
nr:ribosome biogenesis protein BOP1 homolog [Tanacetum cinerariifolium]